ncbi:FkbM family methyltransferase [Pseudomonas sp. YY-1]|nr:FkbM family methyltransferase [Pseudomonas sp. YY-1]
MLRSAPLLIYGARLAGCSVQRYLEAQNIEVTAFLDRDAAKLPSVNGISVFTAEHWAQHHDPQSVRVIIGLFNSYVDQAALVEHLRDLGYSQILSLVDFVRLFPEGQPFRYWLVDPRFYEVNAERLAAVRADLADEGSRELLDHIVSFRTGAGHWYLPEPTPQQYFPADIPSWPAPLRLIDCGAYTGDTVQTLHAAGYLFEALATFEPGLDSYGQLVGNLRNMVGIHFPCGVSDSNRLSGFDPVSGTDGHLLDSGGEPVFCVRLDDALPGFAPNLIKMDIEGEELAALRGAEKLLRRYRPCLAISVYHRAEDLWSIHEYLQGLELGYRFYLRSHARSTFETVLYAIAGERSGGGVS